MKYIRFRARWLAQMLKRAKITKDCYEKWAQLNSGKDYRLLFQRFRVGIPKFDFSDFHLI
jgi:hypothetical protein